MNHGLFNCGQRKAHWEPDLSAIQWSRLLYLEILVVPEFRPHVKMHDLITVDYERMNWLRRKVI